MRLQEQPLDTVVAFDTETDLIGTGQIAPPFVCASFAWRDPARPQEVQQALYGSDPEGLKNTEAALRQILESKSTLLVGHNAAYDMAVVWHQFPELGSLIFEAYADLRIGCTIQAEKQRAVSRSGEIEFVQRPDGSRTPAKYHLDSLGQHYLGKTRTAEKMDPGTWRMNYRLLLGKPAAEYPSKAATYALEDAYDTLLICEHQMKEGLQDPTYASINTWRIRAALDWGNFLCTVRGLWVDQETAEELSARAEEIAAPENLPHLVEEGFLIPPKPEMPYKNGAVDSMTGAPKMKKAQPEKFKDSLFRLYFLNQCVNAGVPVRLTDKGIDLFGKKELDPNEVIYYVARSSGSFDERLVMKDDGTPAKKRSFSKDEMAQLQPWKEESSIDLDALWRLGSMVSVSSEVATTLSVLLPDEPLLEEQARRASVAKLRTTVFPNVLGQPLVHPSFDYPKKTMRTGGRLASKIKLTDEEKAAGKLDRMFASIPVHQMPGKLGGIDPRMMVRAREGFIFVDADYDGLELCTLAQQTYRVLGPHGIRCVHRERINQGYNLHSFLGASLAGQFCPEIQTWYREQGASCDDSRYEAFLGLREQGGDAEALYNHWRTYAKPVGLGYPGRLGKKTMVEFSAATYGVRMSEEDAGLFQNHWHGLYTEMRPYFEWAKSQTDQRNPVLGTTKDGRPIEAYAYQTPLGTWRRGCKMTDFCNGFGMQSPAAEGFNIALFSLQRACYDPSQENVLYGSGVVIPLHDQVLVEVPYRSIEHVRACAAEVKRILVQDMSRICPDVRVNADPALSYVWSKAVRPVYDDQGLLIPWTPAPEKEEAA